MMKNKIKELQSAVANNTWRPNSKRLFAGAEVIITNDANRTSREGDIVVRTEYDKQLSAMFFELKSIFSDYVDAFNKYDFYKRLATAAIDCIDKKGSCEEVLTAVLDEAIVLEGEIDEIYCFAYGSNMDEEQMEGRCPGARPLETACLRGYRFALDESGVATVIKDKDSSVTGVLWAISRENEEVLDMYEGVAAGCYKKTCLEVTTEERTYKPLIYISLRNKGGSAGRTGYMEKIIKAARRWGFDREYVESLEKLTD